MYTYTDFSGVIFDVDDTLLNNFPDGPNGRGLHERSRLAALHEVGRRHGIPELQQITPKENHNGFLTAPVHSLESAVWNLMYGRGLVAVNVPDPKNKILEEIITLKVKLHEKILLEYGAEVPGASEFVQRLADNDFRDKMAIASTAVKRDIDISLQKLGLTDLFPDSRIISLHDVTHPKPHPEAFDLAFATLGLPAETKSKVLVFEDDPRGIMAAKAAGMTVFAITTRFTREQLAESVVAPDLIADSFAEFTDLLGLPAALRAPVALP